jgi:hypothetical protein
MTILVDVFTALAASVTTAVGCTWFLKRTIDHGFNVVLVDRRTAFENSLEEKRQAFTREIQARSEAFQQSLEAFKAQLTLDAEVRRQAAAKKVEILIRLASIADTLIGQVLFVQRDADPEHASAALTTFWRTYNESQAFLEEDTMMGLRKYAVLIETEARALWKREANRELPLDLELIQERVGLARDEFFRIVRAEMHGIRPNRSGVER